MDTDMIEHPEFMTEEDMQLVATATLLGYRFCSYPHPTYGLMWAEVLADTFDGRKWSLPRAAEVALWKAGLRTAEEHENYYHRSDCPETRKVPPELMEKYGQ